MLFVLFKICLKNTFESSHTELWSFINASKQNQDLSHDEQVLSVALYYQLNSVMLYSLDKNMCNLTKIFEYSSSRTMIIHQGSINSLSI